MLEENNFIVRNVLYLLNNELNSSFSWLYLFITDIPTGVFGDHLKQQVEDRLKFYETGEAPPKNVEVMKAAMEEVNNMSKRKNQNYIIYL